MSKLSEQDVAQFIERLDKRREELRWGLLDKLQRISYSDALEAMQAACRPESRI